MLQDLNQGEGEFLVRLARKAITEYLEKRRRIKPPENTPKKLWEKCGVFVTLNALRRGRRELRGCIGIPYPTMPLVEAVIEAAISSATQDPRFLPVSLEELQNITVEVSVLTPPQLIEVESPREYPTKIKVGRDGLIVEKGLYKGLLLPQVPVEWGWDEEEFLCQCCIKAGLMPDCWLEPQTKIYKFQAIIYEETQPNGPIKRKQLES